MADDSDERRRARANELRARIGPLTGLADLLRDPGPRLATGIATLDRACGGGLPSGTRLFLLGKPGAAKTTFAMTPALQWARAGHWVVWMAVDEGARKVGIRLGQSFGLDRQLLQDGDQGEVERLQASLGELPSLAVLDRHYSIEDAIDLLTDRPAGVAGVLVVDSLQRAAARMPDESSRGRVDALLARIVTATEDEGTIALITSEVNRGSYASKNPDEWVDGMAAGKESGGIEYAADVQIVLTPSRGAAGETKATIEKNRLGDERVTFRIAIDKVHARVSEVDDPLADSAEVARDPEEVWSRYETIIRTKLAEHSNGLGGGIDGLAGQVKLRAADARTAINRLVGRGEILVETGYRGAKTLRLARPPSGSSHPRPTIVRDGTQRPPSGRPTPFRGDDGRDEGRGSGRDQLSSREPGEDDEEVAP